MRIVPAACLAIAGGMASAMLLMPATAQQGAIAPLTEADAGRTTTISRGAVLTVTLTHAAGTGYAWRYQFKSGILPVDTRTTTATEAGIVGGPQTQAFQFRVVAPSAEVVFSLARPWERDRPPARTIRYAFTTR